jgi:hypothetical protein
MPTSNKLCKDCRLGAGYRPKAGGMRAASFTTCEGCKQKKPILASRHWVKQK